MKRLLVILLRRYPYDFGEPFFENEVEKHLQYYDKVLVLSQDVGTTSKLTRTPPSGLEYAMTATGKRKVMRIKDLSSIPHLMLHPTPAMQDELNVHKLNIPQRAFLSYFEARCQRMYREAKNILRNINVCQYDQITLYSYWLFANANVGLYLKDYLRRDCGFTGKILLVSRAHRYDIYEEENKLNYLPFRTRLLNGMDYVFPCSNDGTKYLKTKYSKSKAHIHTAYLGSKDYGRSIAANDDQVFHILTCSRVTKVKRIELLIDELALLRPSQNVKWTHIGGGVDGKTNYFDSIRQYAKEKLSNIDFEFIGSLPNVEVYEYYKRNPVDVFINCSYSEGLPVSLMEASGFGIPVIATDVGGSREIIVEKYNGFLLDRDFANGELAERINRLLSMSVSERASMKNAARALWEERFNSEKNYTEFAEMLSKL